MDRIYAGGGDDTIIASTGLDIYDGGLGVDLVDFSGLTTEAGPTGLVGLVFLSEVPDGFHPSEDDGFAFFVGNGMLEEYASAEPISIEHMIGTDYDDRLWVQGAGETVTLEGGAGNDSLDSGLSSAVLMGGPGNDILFAPSQLNAPDAVGHDTVDGGEGDDIIVGGAGNDLITGGPGADRFIFLSFADEGQDTITDFDDSADTVTLFYQQGDAAPDVADLLSQTSAGAVLSYGISNTVLLDGVQMAELDVSVFVIEEYPVFPA
nr:hypothetical protein [Sulfitobacter aestuariivivens]